MAVVGSGVIFWPVWLIALRNMAEPDALTEGLTWLFFKLPVGLLLWVVISYLINWRLRMVMLGKGLVIRNT